MKNKNLILIVIIVIVLAIAGFYIFRSIGSDSKTASNISVQSIISENFVKGKATPDFSFPDFEGNTHSLSDYQGMPVVLDFWAAWCPFCVAEMPELEKASQKHGDKIVIIGMHRTDTESISRGRDFAQDRGVTYLLGSDDGSLYKAAGGFGMPVAVFINKEGIVTEIKSGPKTPEEIEEKVGALVN